ncbi:hypothetical protein D3C87_438520 [compost metagenome]
MKNYKSVSSLTGKSTGVLGYDYDNSSITLHFKTGSVYVYTIASCGLTHLSNMKKLADSQSGLNTYVTKNKPAYASKS